MFLTRLMSAGKLREHAANVMTLVNLSFGITAIILISSGMEHLSLFFILAAALFDRYDGKVARMLQIESAIGKELDSLCDIVSFGVAPALLIYHSILYEIRGAGLIITVLFILCGAIRLAKFNVSENHDVFNGIPITAAGVISVLSYFVIPYFPGVFFLVLQSALMILMVSHIRIQKM